jgi:hypothetical protein
VPEETDAAAVPRPPHRQRQRIALIAGAAATAMAAAVAVIALTAAPANPYATPRSVCTLVSPATVAKYVTGQVHGKSIANGCQWDAGASGGLVVVFSLADNAAQARTGFTESVQAARKKLSYQGTTSIVTGTRAVTGLGDQATVLFESSTTKKHPGTHTGSVSLYIRSRNAIIEVARGAALSGAAPALVPGAIAIAREVMAAMPTLGPGSPGVGVHISLDVSHPVGGVVILGDPGRGDQHRGIAE